MASYADIMKAFRAEVEVTLALSYVIMAETEEEARVIARDRALDGEGFMFGDTQDVQVRDVWDESEEHL